MNSMSAEAAAFSVDLEGLEGDAGYWEAQKVELFAAEVSPKAGSMGKLV